MHGLFSTPFTWLETINGLQADPEIRKRYQFWVFAYPTGNPILYSALRLRQELAKADQLYPNHKPYVVVGHSMGGMLTHYQVATVTGAMWEKAMGQTAKNILNQNSSDSLLVRSLTFQANPRIKRVVFICTPHRGSDLATGGLGRFAISIITLPTTLATTMRDSLTSGELVQLTGASKRLPDSVWGLKPSNPAVAVLNEARISVPYHSIIGDRGKGGCPNCSDGVVAYWSSHLNGAQSELIVPGPHGSCELPQTIAELDRILRLHLKQWPKRWHSSRGALMAAIRLITLKFPTGSIVRSFCVSISPLRRLAVFWAALFIATLARGQDPLHPLKPTDLSSPRATLKTFLDAGDAVGASLVRDYLPSPSRTKFDHLVSLAGPVVKCLDLTEVAPAARRKTGLSAAAALYETLSRIQLPPFDQIPDAAQLSGLSGSNAERWVIPDTEIVIERVKSGPRSGEFLFSAGTVARSEEFYERVRGLPYTRPVPLEYFREIIIGGGGWMIPLAWIKALPPWLRTPSPNKRLGSGSSCS